MEAGGSGGGEEEIELLTGCLRISFLGGINGRINGKPYIHSFIFRIASECVTTQCTLL